MPCVELRPGELLSARGFDDGRLLDGYVGEVLGGLRAVADPTGVGFRPAASFYGSSRHLLRFLVEEHLLPTLPWAADLVFHDDPSGSPVRLWLQDVDGCPLRGVEERVLAAPPVVVDSDVVASAARVVYPLRSAAQIRLYHALALPWTEHRSALALVLPFLGLDDDVVGLAAEIFACGPRGSEDEDVLVVASRLFDAVTSARSLVG